MLLQSTHSSSRVFSHLAMPSTTPPVDGKSRQSSGGRSFFGRKLHKDRPSEYRGQDEGNYALDVPSASSSTTGSRSSRHSHRPSRSSLDLANEEEAAGISMTAGVITAIPYESVAADARTPIPVDYLPKNDKVPARKDPLPHHLNKGGGDYHQYPAWDPQNPNPPNGSSHPTGPRPPPHSSLKPSYASRELPRKPVQSPNPGDATTSTANGSHGASNSFSTGDMSPHRSSSDQVSVISSISSATRGSSIFSSDNSSRTAIPSHTSDHRPSSSSRQSHYHTGWQPQHPPGLTSTTSFNPDGFSLPRPTDDKLIEQQFLDLMQKRGWHNLPEQARRQMMAYPAAKKWTLVHQDKLTEWQGEQKRRQNARQTIIGTDAIPGILARSEEEGSPEWYVRKVMNDSITAKQLGSLSVSLRTQPIRYGYPTFFLIQWSFCTSCAYSIRFKTFLSPSQYTIRQAELRSHNCKENNINSWSVSVQRNSYHTCSMLFSMQGESGGGGGGGIPFRYLAFIIPVELD